MGWDNPNQKPPAFLESPRAANDNERKKGLLVRLWELLFGETH